MMNPDLAIPKSLRCLISRLPEQPEDIKKIELPMTIDGWNKMRAHFPKQEGIYLLFKDQRCLRIGMAGSKDGIYGRWFLNLGSHYYCYQGLSPPSSKHYYYFYRQIEELWQSISAVFLIYPNADRSLLLEAERFLIKKLSPIWEIRIDGKLLWTYATEEFQPSIDVFFSPPIHEKK